MSELSRAELMADPRPRLPVKAVAEIIKVVVGSVAHEKAIHYALPGCLRLRRRNEWFHLTPELREAIKMLPSAERKDWR